MMTKYQIYIDENFLVIQQVANDGTTTIGLPINQPAKDLTCDKHSDGLYYITDKTTNKSIISGFAVADLFSDTEGGTFANESAFVAFYREFLGKSSAGGGANVVTITPFIHQYNSDGTMPQIFSLPSNTYVQYVRNETDDTPTLAVTEWSQSGIDLEIDVSSANGDVFGVVGFTLSSTPVEQRKVYRALISQSAVPNQTEGDLIVGHEYRIIGYQPIDDFTNVGASENTTGISFVAIDTTPAIWLSGSALVDLTLGAPNILLLDDTIGITSVDFDYDESPRINFTAVEKFIEDKTYSPQSSVRMTNTDDLSFYVQANRINNNLFRLITISDGHEIIAGALLNTLIEIYVNP